jgi:hypothetical protein
VANVAAYLAKQYLDWSLGGAAATQPAACWVGLSIGNPKMRATSASAASALLCAG